MASIIFRLFAVFLEGFGILIDGDDVFATGTQHYGGALQSIVAMITG